MQKIFIFLCSIFFSFNVLAHEFTNKKEYTIKYKKVNDAPKVMEFFSFFCPYCYEFEKKYNTRHLIHNNFKKNINIETYHVNFLGGKFSNVLTKSWIIAQQMKIEEKIMLPMFKGIQETHTINNINDIRDLFFKEAGVNINEYNKFWNSLSLKILIQKKNKEVEKSNLDHVPEMIINGKYIIDYSRLEKVFKNHFSQKYIKLINFLINKK